MGRGYGQYCPLALAAELLCTRWTLLVVSRLLDGCHRFREIQQGLPQMSSSLLSKRLQDLTTAGLVERRPRATGRGYDYHLTAAGQALDPLVDGLAVWGQEWARDMTHEDLDPAFLVWSMHRRVDPSVLPDPRTVIEFHLSGSPTSCDRFWLVCRGDDVEMCLKDPGLEIDLAVEADLRLFVEAWRGFRDLESEIGAGRIRVHGPPELVRRVPDLLLGSALATVPRRRAGPERRRFDRTQ